MKTGKRLLALLLTAVLLFSLTGCGAFETKMARAMQKLSKLDSLRLEILDDLVVNVTAAGRTAPVTVTLSGTVDLYPDPLLAKADLLLEWPGAQLQLLYFIEENGDVLDVYRNVNGGEAWLKETLAQSKSDLKVNGLKYVIEGAETFDQVEQPGVTDGSIRFDGQIPGSFIQGYLELYRVADQLEQDFGLTLDEDLFTNLNGVPTSLWLNSKGELDLIMLEPSALLNGLLTKLLQEGRSLSGVDQLALAYSIDSNQIVIRLGEFDGLEAMEIPAEARAASGESFGNW